MRQTRLWAFAFICVALATLHAQTGQLSGQIVDESGEALPGVRVVVALQANPQITQTTTTDGTGQFRVVNLQPGTYRVEVSRAGFSRVVRTVDVGTGRAAVLRVAMSPQVMTAPPPPPPPPPPVGVPRSGGAPRGAPPDAAERPPAAGRSPDPAPEAGTATVPVFYATDRERVAGNVLTYGTARNPGESLFFGRFDVSVPRDHRMGQVERPTIWTLWTEDPAKHFVITKRAQLSDADFYTGLRGLVDTSERKEAFVFIHGFNVAFEDAVYRTAQLAYDLGFDGAPILYSWPSLASVSPLAYTTDSNNSDWTVPHLRWFLETLVRRSGAQRVHLIAHSMGNKALVNALNRMSPAATRRFSQIVLTAPDIDRSVFVQLADAVKQNAERTTLYASSNDKALSASKALASYPRAGDATGGVVIVPGIDSVDVSALATDFLGHGYYGSSDSVLTDLFLLIREGLPPPRPRLRRAGAAPNLFWRFVP